MAWLVLSLATLLLGGFAGGDVVEETLDRLDGAEANQILEETLNGGGDGVPTTPVPEPQVPYDDIAGISATAALAGVLLSSFIAAGTKHVTRDNVLEHETRRGMYEFLWESGSAHLRKIATALDLSTTNATWHLDKLVKAGLVGEVKVNGYRMYYPKGAGRIQRDQCLLSAQVQSDNAKAVVEYVAENPGAHQREIARALDVNHGTARWHLSRLADAGILTVERKGRTTTYKLTEHAEHVLTRTSTALAGPAAQGA